MCTNECIVTFHAGAQPHFSIIRRKSPCDPLPCESKPHFCKCSSFLSVFLSFVLVCMHLVWGAVSGASVCMQVLCGVVRAISGAIGFRLLVAPPRSCTTLTELLASFKV